MTSSLLDGAQDALDFQRGPASGLARSMPVTHTQLDKSAASPPLVDNADTARVSEAVTSPSKDRVRPLDLMVSLKRAEPSIVKTRTGSVLSRGFILKTDYYPSGWWLSTWIPGLLLTRGARQDAP
jgi:hypothetical protein